MTESQATSKFLQKLNTYGFFWKASDRFRAGIPDIIGLYAGRFVSIEMKIDLNTPTPLQVYTMAQVLKHKGYAGVVTYSNKTKQWWICGTAYDIEGATRHIIGKVMGGGNDIE